jgi:hypothetical protein
MRYLVIHPRQDMLQILDNSHLAAQVGEDCGELDADYTAAHDCEGLGQLADADQAVGADDEGVLAVNEVGDERL